MTTHSCDDSQRIAARILGLAYPLSFVLVVAVNFGILQPLTAGVDPVHAAQNILAHATLFRLGALGFAFYCVGVLVVSAALYVILRPVDQTLALLATLGRLVHGFTWLLVTLNLFTALRLLSRPEYAGLPPDQLPVLAQLYLSGFDQYYVGLLFWSLGATVGAFLWFKSSYVPRALAIFGMLASSWCACCTLILLVWRDFTKVVNLWWFDSPMALFEISLSLLLLLRGLRPSGLATEQP
jgi:hypothetical protein